MNRLRFSLLTAICLLVPSSAVWSAPVPAARSGLEQVPDSTAVVVHLRGVQGTRDNLVAMMKNALPDVLKMFQSEMDDFLQNGKDGRKIRGLRKDGPIFLAITELPKSGQPLNGPPPLAVIVAVSEYKEFLKGILTEEEHKGITDKGDGVQSATLERETVYFLDHKGYAVITPSEDVAKSFTKKYTGLHSKMSKELAAKLLASDLGLYVSMEAVNKEYGDDIKKAKEGIEQLLQLAAGSVDESQKQGLEFIKKLLDPTFQTIEDMQALLLTAEMRSGGLALHLESELKESSPTGNLLQDSRPIELKELERLPRDRHVYLGMKANAALFKNLGGLIAGLPAGATDDASALMKELAKAGPESMLVSASLPIVGLTVYHYDNPTKAVETMLKMYNEVDPQSAKLKRKPKVGKAAEKYGDFKLHKVEMELDFDKMAEEKVKGGDDAKKQYVEAMKGVLGEKTTLWFGTDGKSVVQLNAKDWSTAQTLLDQYTKGSGTVGEDKEFKEVRNEMPKRTSALLLIDAAHLAGNLIEVFKPLLPPGMTVPPGWPNKPAKGSNSYVGIALTLQPGRGSVDLFVSAAAAREFYKAVIKPFVGE